MVRGNGQLSDNILLAIDSYIKKSNAVMTFPHAKQH